MVCVTPCLISPEEKREFNKVNSELRTEDSEKENLSNKSPILRKKDHIFKRSKLGKGKHKSAYFDNIENTN